MIKKNEKEIRIKKQLPCSLVYTDEIEKWLDNMALDGYELKMLTENYAFFVEGENRDIRHHLHYSITYSDIDDSKQLIADGYELLLKDQIVYEVGLLKNDIAVSVYITDEIAKGYEYSEHHNNEKMKAIKFRVKKGLTVIVANWISLVLFILGSNAWKLEIALLILWLSIPFVLIFAINLSIYLKEKSLIRYYEEKYYLPDIPSPDEYHKSRKRKKFVLVLLIFQCVFSILTIIPFIKPKLNVNWINDVVTLQIVEGEQKCYLSDESLDKYERMNVSSTLIVPMYYTIDNFVDSKEKGNSYIVYNVYCTRSYFKKIIDLSYNEWLKGTDDSLTNIEIGDYAISYYQGDVYGVDDRLFMAFVSENEIIKIEYSGCRKPEEIAENVVDFLSN